ncbi:MAG TPA: GH3 auxin-responsive promoter family protein [Bdellovibrionota bacterium]|jgi:hypothetical protein|nr:GH3 auxin-responsive promoter family protein [Bdellovibrionota bacterium]
MSSSNPHLKRIPAGPVTSAALRTLAHARVARWNAHARNPRDIQIRTLLAHCRAAADTEFGRTHGLAGVRSYEDYKARVPLRTYADFEPYLERMRKGARDVLWPGLIPYYGQSSGSSNTKAQHKYLPVSWEQIRWQKKAMFDLVARYLILSGDKGFTSGYSLGLLPPAVVKPESPGVMVGSNPGIMFRHVPKPARLVAIPRPPIRDIPDYDEKLKAIANEYMDYDVRSISATTCWFSVMFDRLLEAARARGRNVSTVNEIWPNLKVLFGGGVHAGPYRKIIRERIGHDVVLMDNYNATEGGVFAVLDRLDEEGMLVVPDRGVFYEFVPRAQHGRPDAIRVPLWNVEPGVDYSVVLTTSSGLFGYYIGDFVRFTSIFPHRLEFSGRASGVLSLTQELTSFIEIERSFTAACEKHGATVVDYAASSEVGVEGTGKGRYVFFAEFERAPADPVAFTSAVDAELRRENRVYGEHRVKDVAILPPRMVTLAPGTTRKFMDALGYSSVQNKFPRIIDNQRRDLLLSMAVNNSDVS